jgi:hypothetical protein
MTPFEVNVEGFPVLKVLVGPLEYTLCYPVSAVIKAEEATKLSLKNLNDWLKIESRNIPAILAAGFIKYHSDLQPDAMLALAQSIFETLTPEALDQLHYMLCKLAFPKAMEALETRASGKANAVSPNVQSPDVA